VSDAGLDLIESQRAQVLRDLLRRAELAVAEFGVLVDVVAPLDDLRHDRFDRRIELLLLDRSGRWPCENGAGDCDRGDGSKA